MALAAYAKECGKNTSGNLNKVFFTEVANISTITITDSEIAGVTMATGKGFQPYTAEIDSVQMKVEGNAGQNYYTTQTLVMKFAKRTVSLSTAIAALTDTIACGIAAIRVDGNGIAWLSGYDGAAIDKASRPYNKIKVTYDSGLKPSDAEGNAVTVELTRESEYDEIPFDATRSALIIAGGADLFKP